MRFVLVDTLDNNPPVMAVFQETVQFLEFAIAIHEVGSTPITQGAQDILIPGYPIESAFLLAGDVLDGQGMAADAEIFYRAGIKALGSNSCTVSSLAFPIDTRTDLLLELAEKLEFFLSQDEKANCYCNLIAILDDGSVQKQAMPSKQHDLCCALYHVGLKLVKLGRMNPGLSCAQRGFSMRKDLMVAGFGGPWLHSFPDWYQSVAESLDDQGFVELAEDLLRGAVECMEEIFDERVPQLIGNNYRASALHNLGSHHLRYGDSDRGFLCLERAVKINAQFLQQCLHNDLSNADNARHQLFQSLMELGDCLLSFDRLDESLSVYERGVSVGEGGLPNNWREYIAARLQKLIETCSRHNRVIEKQKVIQLSRRVLVCHDSNGTMRNRE